MSEGAARQVAVVLTCVRLPGLSLRGVWDQPVRLVSIDSPDVQRGSRPYPTLPTPVGGLEAIRGHRGDGVASKAFR
ncbi:unnamed protein product [Euphydryas editha]|uniref:Uncharacterized protein n=1 Tax=Euphydryas editha TaxID=104508 RepID=A0AAU9TZF1_EUPED|nr:unnamed protein product [Euphydryas editha]